MTNAILRKKSRRDAFPCKSLTALALAVSALCSFADIGTCTKAGAGMVDITTLGAKWDGSEDVSDIINRVTQTDPVFLPPGVYKVAKPLRLRNPLRGSGYSRIPKVNASRTWLVSAIPDAGGAAGVIEFADNTCATVENLNVRCKGDVNGIRIANCTAGMVLDFKRIGIFGVRTCGLYVEGWGSRPVFAGDMTIWGDTDSSTRSVAVHLGGACDCRLTNIEMMGVAVGVESFNAHTYGANLHIWTGIFGKKDPDDWWTKTRSIILGAGANFEGSEIYPDTSYYAIEFRGPGGTCEIGNVMYWEDDSVAPVKTRNGAFLCPDAAGAGRLIVHGGLVGVSGSDKEPGAMSRVYSPRQTMSGVMMKSNYRICPENIDRLCLGGDLPDYTVSYKTNAYSKVADILTAASRGTCEARLVRDDGAAWSVSVVKAREGEVAIRAESLNDLGAKDDVKMTAEGNHVKVFLRPHEGEKPWTARFTTVSMCDYCRPIDHGSLRKVDGGVRYRECLK